MTGILAHRGYSKSFPENTLLAFKEAAKLRIDGFETDIQMTKDGYLVLTHDEEVSRVSNGVGYVKDMTLEELKKLNFNAGMSQFGADECRIITLDEFFDYFKDTDLIFNLELKTSQVRYEGMVEKVINMIEKYSMEDRVIISSFNHRDVIKCKKLKPELKCGFLTWSVFMNPGKYTLENGVDYYHPDYNSMDSEDWNQCRELKVRTLPYTIDNPEDMRRMADEGTLYIITNDPELAVEVLGKRD